MHRTLVIMSAFCIAHVVTTLVLLFFHLFVVLAGLSSWAHQTGSASVLSQRKYYTACMRSSCCLECACDDGFRFVPEGVLCKYY